MRFLYLQIIASGLLLWRLFGSPCPSYAANKPVGSDSAKLAAVDPTPSVAIVSPVDGASVTETNLTVRVNVRLPAGSTLRSVRAMVDGRLAAQVRGVRLTTSPAAPMDAPFTHELTVSISPRDCVLTVVAETSALKLEPASVSLHWSGPDASRNPEQRPRLYVLAVGVSDYQQSELRLRFAGKDARDLAEAFSKQGRTLYRSIETKILTDAGAKKNGILDGLEWLQRSTTAKDIAVLFLAGHGITDPSTGNYYFLPFDADMNGIKRSMIAESELRDTLSSIPGKVLLFLDTCHAGKIFALTQGRGPGDLASFVTELSSAENGVVVFAASTGRQASQEAAAWNNGAFTKAVLEGLRGRADQQKTGRVTLNMLDLYISERVKQLTEGRQTPTTAKPATIPDFPIAIVREVSNDDVELVR